MKEVVAMPGMPPDEPIITDPVEDREVTDEVTLVVVRAELAQLHEKVDRLVQTQRFRERLIEGAATAANHLLTTICTVISDKRLFAMTLWMGFMLTMAWLGEADRGWGLVERYLEHKGWIGPEQIEADVDDDGASFKIADTDTPP